MGVFKWLRRERVTVSTGHVTSTSPDDPPVQMGTIRTEEYKRDLAEFQARRSSASKDLDTPTKKKCGRHSLPVSCADCSGDPDRSFNYEKKSANKYKKKSHRRTRSAQEENYDGPNIQFLFQNQVFMPGNMFPASSYSAPKARRRHRSPDFLVQKHIDFDDNQPISPPMFYKNNSLPFDVKAFLEEKSDVEEVDGMDASGDLKASQNGVKNDSCEEKLWEVMSELKNFDRWADEQLQDHSVNTTKSEDTKSIPEMTTSPEVEVCEGRHREKTCMPDEKVFEGRKAGKGIDELWPNTLIAWFRGDPGPAVEHNITSTASTFGLPVASSCNLSMTVEKNKVWSNGKWGVIPVQVKKLIDVTIEHVRKKTCMEINILRKCRHPNIILLMGLYPDAQNNVHIICERCIDTLFNLLHIEGHILSVQTSVQYALDVANALVYLRMHGYVHSGLNSTALVVAPHAAKLADLSTCLRVPRRERNKTFDVYSPEPQYVNLNDPYKSNSVDCEPLLSERSSEAYLSANSVTKHYKAYSDSEMYQWQAPELFTPDDDGFVRPCSTSDVYSLSIILWESCNASLPWKSLSYSALKQEYTVNKRGVSLPQDGTYPGSLLSLLRQGLTLDRQERLDLSSMQERLHTVKKNLDEMEYIIIPERLSKSQFNSTKAWEDTTSPTDSECQSPKNIQHEAMIHSRLSSKESVKDTKSNSPVYETIPRLNSLTFTSGKCSTSDDDEVEIKHNYKDKNYSSYCSTPVDKIRAKVKDIETPGTLQRSDSTEYCSILSPEMRYTNLNLYNSFKDQTCEPPTAKLSRSFTPKSYKPLHIKVPEFNLDSVKSILKEQTNKEKSSYNFDIKNYSLPTTPIARSNKLRKNAWLSGDINTKVERRNSIKHLHATVIQSSEGTDVQAQLPETKTSDMSQKMELPDVPYKRMNRLDSRSTESLDTARDSYTGLKRINDPPHDFSSPEMESAPLERTRSLSSVKVPKYKIDEDVLASINVKPLVAIHERWIHEANKKTCRSLSLPEPNRAQTHPVKPASHCVTLQKSLPQLFVRRTSLTRSSRAPSPASSCKNGNNWEQYYQAREAISKGLNLQPCDTIRKSEKSTITDTLPNKEPKIDRSTDTQSLENFIKDLIRKEVQHLLSDMSDNTSESTNSFQRGDEMINKGVNNIVESLKNADLDAEKIPIKSYSRIKINGNNKPLVQITFSRSGENSLQILDNCVNVTLSDTGASRDKLNVSMEDTLTGEDIHINALKRCQAFSAIQEARSTEDLYIDDDLSTQMQENFGGKVKLIPLHGSLHEILCEKEDDCCLIKVKQENGCDTIYFRCDNSDTESRDAIDGQELRPKDTVVFKRSISLIEERIQRVFPKDKRQNAAALRKLNDKLKTRPKSEVFLKTINKESRGLSNSSPSLIMKDKADEVELNIENLMCYQDSSSDECLRCQTDEDFEMLEREIEEDLANSSSLTCGCLEKISEENLSVINED